MNRKILQKCNLWAAIKALQPQRTEPKRIRGNRGKMHGEGGGRLARTGGRGLIQFRPFSRDCILLEIGKHGTFISTVFAENDVCDAVKCQKTYDQVVNLNYIASYISRHKLRKRRKYEKPISRWRQAHEDRPCLPSTSYKDVLLPRNFK